MARQKKRQLLGHYRNLQKHRTELGWSISELLTKVSENPPSEKSVRRLEAGQPIRMTTVNKLFNVINAAPGFAGKLDRHRELKEFKL